MELSLFQMFLFSLSVILLGCVSAFRQLFFKATYKGLEYSIVLMALGVGMTFAVLDCGSLSCAYYDEKELSTEMEYFSEADQKLWELSNE